MTEQLWQAITAFRPLYESAERILKDVPVYDEPTAYRHKTILFCGRAYRKDCISEHDLEILRRIDAEFSKMRALNPELGRALLVGDEYPFLVQIKFAN